MAEPKFAEGPWECVAAEFGQGENAGLVGFWVRMPYPSLCKADANLIEAALPMYEALKRIMSDLPTRRDWLDPVTERMAKAALAKARGEAR